MKAMGKILRYRLQNERGGKVEYWVVDQIEEELAVCEHGGQMESIPLVELPQGLREGDCLFREDGGFSIDRAETARRREENLRLMRLVFGE